MTFQFAKISLSPILSDVKERQRDGAGVARQAHNLKVVSSNLTPATNILTPLKSNGVFLFPYRTSP